MIGKIIDALNAYEYYGETNEIDIAKGKYSLPSTLKGGIYQAKRILKKPKDD